MYRRALLASIGTLGTASLAGCVDSGLLSDSSTTLRRLSVNNWDKTSGHSYSLRVERDGTVVHESTHDVGPSEDGILSGQTVQCTWEAVPGRYAVSVRIDGAEWHSFDVLDNIEATPDCVTASVEHQSTSDGTDSPWLRVRDDCDRYTGQIKSCSTEASTSN